jgi:hypothetical protein
MNDDNFEEESCLPDKPVVRVTCYVGGHEHSFIDRDWLNIWGELQRNWNWSEPRKTWIAAVASAQNAE